MLGELHETKNSKKIKSYIIFRTVSVSLASNEKFNAIIALLKGLCT